MSNQGDRLILAFFPSKEIARPLAYHLTNPGESIEDAQARLAKECGYRIGTDDLRVVDKDQVVGWLANTAWKPNVAAFLGSIGVAVEGTFAK